MGTTTFTGPITAGDIVNTSGTTLGTNVANVGFVEMVQTVAVTQATNGTTAGLYTTNIVIPAQKAIVTARKTAGDSKITSFDLGIQDTGDDGTGPTGCDWHPNVVDHQRMAGIITAQLKAKLGW